MGDRLDDEQWQREAEAAFAAIAAWRRAHPQATFAEIETAIDAELTRVRARVVTDTVEASPVAAFAGQTERPRCPRCGAPLQAKGAHPRQITNHRGETVKIDRTYGQCPGCGAGLFPPG